jgi:primosomal protein N' (replication factor Y)
MPGEVVVQTLHEGEPAIRFAIHHDYDGFAEWELPLRHEAALPPFTRMVRLLIRHRQSEKAEQAARGIAEAVRQALLRHGVTVIGPQAAGVPKIRNQYRFHLVLISSQPGLIQQVLWPRMEALCRMSPAELLADVDPVNLL